MTSDATDVSYALELANSSYEWYRRAAIKARRYHRLTEVLQLVCSAAIPVSAVLIDGNTAVPAVLGAVVVVVTGLRSSFHWHDDYLRFNQAREAVEAQRRLFRTGAHPYNSDTREEVLAKAVTEIEQNEMGAWLKIAQPEDESRPRQHE
ncbi:DUF4231 domain-containing protein [Nocardia gipuzkoensis]|uniref:DUF4231 domain-containing protein n=1 Tax=Nocardia gipuzkoensis TaxID=2749991 RepID=UPI001E3A14D5|nr:DUF4231 domain-containing protein [Nocardia gipuzkoensis]UGT70871.1 DUF4231 domain-containing protein [Nocardia gipuzkoensis]